MSISSFKSIEVILRYCLTEYIFQIMTSRGDNGTIMATL